MRFDLADLSLFLTIVEAGSITHGAARANLSLPAASERLRDMEAASGKVTTSPSLHAALAQPRIEDSRNVRK